jgi:hypothetical protein
VDYAAGHPVANLALIRAMFFAEPGRTLGAHSKRVTSQAQAYDPAFPSDAEYVENVMWEQSQVLFVTINVPGGSNNDSDTWNAGAFGSAFAATGNTKSAPQLQDLAQRTGADLRWLDAAFARADAHHVKAVVIVDQADMWDLDGTLPADNHLAKYEPLIAKMAAKSQAFGKPVLLFNGDSHHYRSDNPLKQQQPCVTEAGAASTACSEDDWATHPNYDVSNFHRVVVHGSTFPLEYLRLAVDTRVNNAPSATSFGPFSWERVIRSLRLVGLHVVDVQASFEVSTKHLGTGPISLLGACELQQLSQQGKQRLRRQIAKAFAAAVREHYAAFIAGDFYQTCPVMPENDICAVFATKRGPRRCTSRHWFKSPLSLPLLHSKSIPARAVPKIRRAVRAPRPALRTCPPRCAVPSPERFDESAHRA